MYNFLFIWKIVSFVEKFPRPVDEYIIIFDSVANFFLLIY